MACVDTGATTATTQTQAFPGPAGVSAVLRVSSADDHSANSHLCNADYQLLLRPAAAGEPKVIDLISSAAEYGRRLTLRLNGFSQDGKQVLGILSEGGQTPSTLLFDYNQGGGGVELIDVRKQFAHLLPARCSAASGVIGTTASGAIVLEVNSHCGPNRRWVVDSGGSRPWPFPPNAAVLGLYNGNAP